MFGGKEGLKCDVNMSNVKHLHLGADITIDRPATLRGIRETEIFCRHSQDISGGDICPTSNNLIESPVLHDGNKERKTFKVRDLMKNLSVRKLIFFGFVITLFEMFGLFLHYKINDKWLFNGNDVKRLNEMHMILNNFIQNENKWSYSKGCTFQCPIKEKSIVRFVISKTLSYECTLGNESCSSLLISERDELSSKLKIPLNDVIFNYIISRDGNIYLGRALTCPLDEDPKFLENEGVSSTIFIAIPFCFLGNTDIKPGRDIQTVVHLLNKLQEYRFLRVNYTVEFPLACRNTLLFKWPSTELFRVNYYENDFYNIGSRLNTEKFKNLFFVPDEKKVTSKVRVTNLTNNSTFYTNCDEKNDANLHRFVERLIIRHLWYTNIEDNLPRFVTIARCDSIHLCKSFVERLYEMVDEVRNFSINYFVFQSGFVIRGEPINCSSEKNNTGVNVLIIPYFYRSRFKADEAFLDAVLDLFKPIAADIDSSLNFGNLEIEILCPILHKDEAKTTFFAGNSNGPLSYFYKYLTNTYWCRYKEGALTRVSYDECFL